MRIVKRTLRLLVVAAFIGSAVLWWRSYTRSHVLAVSARGYLQSVASHRGGVVAFFSAVPYESDHFAGVDVFPVPPADLDDALTAVFDPQVQSVRSVGGLKLASGSLQIVQSPWKYTAVRLPFPIVVTVLGMCVLFALRAPLRSWRWGRQGRCRQCGYDLRETPGRCPECGANTPRAELCDAPDHLEESRENDPDRRVAPVGHEPRPAGA